MSMKHRRLFKGVSYTQSNPNKEMGQAKQKTNDVTAHTYALSLSILPLGYWREVCTTMYMYYRKNV